MSLVVLKGCTPDPLAAYLRALAVLRLVTEQKDEGATGYWQDDAFHLKSSLDEAALVRFFVDEYQPTPIVAPWNGGSGFHPNDDKTGLRAIQGSDTPRFEGYRRVIHEVLSWDEVPRSDGTLGELQQRLRDVAARGSGKKADELLTLIGELDAQRPQAARLLGAELLGLTFEELEARAKGQKSKELSSFVAAAKKIRNKVQSLARGDAKEDLLRVCRQRLEGPALDWLDAALVLDGNDIPRFSPLLGAGGNEGRADYTNWFMAQLRLLLIGDPKQPCDAAALLRQVLLDQPARGLGSVSAAKFDPGRAGGANQGNEIEAAPSANPWTLVLALEGAIVWSSGLSSRKGRYPALASPFTVQVSAVGYASAGQGDQDSYKEIWTPLWEQPTSYRELRAVLAEGRAEVRHHPRRDGADRIEVRRARNGVDFARAAASLGVDRGINAFVRYGLLERRGQGYYVATPMGRFPVRHRDAADLAAELDPALERIDGFLRQFRPQPPARWLSARRGIDEALFNVYLHGQPVHMKRLVAAIGRLEQLIAVRPPEREPSLSAPPGGLSLRWVQAADDGSLEVRLAAALASIYRSGEAGPLRANLMPQDPEKPWSWAKARPQVCYEGNSLAERLLSVLEGRLRYAGEGARRPTAGQLPLPVADVAGFLAGEADDGLLEDLLFGFGWIDWYRSAKEERPDWSEVVQWHPLPREYALLKLLFWPAADKADAGLVEQALSGATPAGVLPLLRAGRVADACEMARRRLFAAGLSPLRIGYGNSSDGRRLGAALLLPVRRNELRNLSRSVCQVQGTESEGE